MNVRYTFCAGHPHPDYRFHDEPIAVGTSSQGPNLPPLFYATHPKLGCGKDARTPEAAIRLLVADHGCSTIIVTKIEDKHDWEIVG